MMGLEGGLMVMGARALSESLVDLAHQAGSYQLSGQEMVFIVLLVACVIGGWIGYEWIRRGRAL